MVLVGPAGTGKTVALHEATVTLAERHGAHRVVGVAPDRSAARAWQRAVARELPGAAPLVTTVTGLAQQVLLGTPLGAAAAHRAPAAPPDEDGPLRILTAPEQELRIREVLAGAPDTGWPAEWKDAVGTRSFARQLRRAVAHARRWGWEPDDLQRVARDSGDDGWLGVSRFLTEYLQILDWEGSLDYPEVTLRALRRWERDGAGDLVIVADDLHLLDPTQARLLATATARGLLLGAGDPDQCVASYRGADPAAFRFLLTEAQAVRLTTVHRGGAAMRDARAQLFGSRWYPGLPPEWAPDYRQVAAAAGADHLAAVEYDDAHTQARHVAHRLRAEHRAGRPWRHLAVLVSSPAAETAELVRALGQARIPVHVPTADAALVEQQAVATLLRAADLVLAPDPFAPHLEATWRDLATSDLGQVAPRLFREFLRWAATGGEACAADLARDPLPLAQCPDRLREVADALTDLAGRVRSARRRESQGATPAEVLWEVWHGPDGAWPERLRRRAIGTGAAAVAAGRDLDAVIEVFRLAERAPERWGGHRGLAALVAELGHQEIPAEPDLSLGPPGDRVTVMSLHRAAGREWPVVIVTGLQESNWQARDGGGLIEVARLTGDELLAQAPRQAAAEMRRLFGMALGRAGRTLVLAACGGAGDPPTSLLADAGLTVERVAGPPDRPQTPVDVLLQARRRALLGPTADQRSGAVAALAALTGERDGAGGPRFPGADPRTWDGARDWTVGVAPLRPAGRPLSLSGSALAVLDGCALRWLLQRELSGDRSAGPQVGFGLTVHAAAAAIVAGDTADSATLVARSWCADDYDADWHAAQERRAAVVAVDRLRDWLATRPGALAAERPIEAVLPVRDPEGTVVDAIRVTGSVDLVETHADGVAVWDYKTRRTAAAAADVAHDVQLAVYQAALAELTGQPAAGGGLVFACVPAGTREPLLPKVRRQEPLALRQEWADGVLVDAAGALRSEQFRATPGPGCRTCAFAAMCPARGPGGRR